MEKIGSCKHYQNPKGELLPLGFEYYQTDCKIKADKYFHFFLTINHDFRDCPHKKKCQEYFNPEEIVENLRL